MFPARKAEGNQHKIRIAFFKHDNAFTNVERVCICAQWKTLYCALAADSILLRYSLEWIVHPIKWPMQPVHNPNILYKRLLLGISLEGGAMKGMVFKQFSLG